MLRIICPPFFRSVLHPSDLVKFDLQVSPHEVEALHWRASEYEDVEGPDEGSYMCSQC